MSMTKTRVLALLKENRNERGIEHWKKKPRKLKSFGVGLTQLRKLAKQIGRDHKLAQQLWKSDVYDAKIIGLLIDDPKQLSREQAEEQVEGLQGGMFSHVFASCDATLAKTPFAFELARDWMESKDDMRRRCGYTLLYELSKKNPKGMDDAYLLGRIDHIQSRDRRRRNVGQSGDGRRADGDRQAEQEAQQGRHSCAAKAIGPSNTGTTTAASPWTCSSI